MSTQTQAAGAERSLPAWIYTDEAFFERERRTVFRTGWQVVCHLADVPHADRAYARAFHTIGIDVDALEPAEAARRIKERFVAMELVTALDDWAALRRLPAQEMDWQRLYEIARRVDTHAVRSRLRDAVARQDYRALEKLAVSPEVRTWPAATCVLRPSRMARTIGAEKRIGRSRLTSHRLRSGRQRRTRATRFRIVHKLARLVH